MSPRRWYHRLLRRPTLTQVLALGVAASFTVAFLSGASSGTSSSLQSDYRGESAQAAAVTQLTDLNEWSPTAEQAAAGWLPIRVAPVAEIAALAVQTPSRVAAAAANEALHSVALVVRTRHATSTIYAAYALSTQLTPLLDDLAKAGVRVTITSPIPAGSTSSTALTAPTANPYAGRAGYYPTRDPVTPAAVAPAAPSSSRRPNSGLIWLGVILLIMLAWRSSIRHQRGRAALPAASAPVDVPATRFADVAGCDEAIEDMQELVLFLSEPERFTRLGATPPRGALLVGPPGTGKTLLARAVAGEAGVPFYPVSGSDFVEMYVGVGAKRVRELFTKAREHEDGAIVFIDEIDAIGRRRSGAGAPGHNSEQENTLNALLVEMDGFAASRVIVLAATNRDDILDPALTRPGRLDRKVHVPLPDRAARERILAVHARNKPLAEDVDLVHLARRTPGMSGAELAQVVNEACMAAARRDQDHVTAVDFDDAIATVTMGKARTSAMISEEDRVLTAWHEAGHAVCGLVQLDAVSPVSISIVPRGQAGGVTHFPSRDSGYLTRRQAYAQLVTAMGGMAAEQLHLGDGEFTTGPSGDLQQGSNMALAMVTQYGMGESLLVKSDALLTAAGSATDDAVTAADDLLRQALADARELLADNHALVEHLVTALLEYETLTHAQIDDLVRGRNLVDPAGPPPAPRREPVAVATPPVLRPAPAGRAPEREPVLAALAAVVYHRLIGRARRRRRRHRGTS